MFVKQAKSSPSWSSGQTREREMCSQKEAHKPESVWLSGLASPLEGMPALGSSLGP